MSLPWFSFNIKAFVTDTMRLNTEAKGAYLLLMLDYYEQGGPAPDDDAVLATITGLSPEAWDRHRRVIEPLFQIAAGHWHHERIEAELLVASSKHSKAVEKAKLASAASHSKPRSRPAPSQLQASPKPKPPPKPATSQLQAAPKEDLEAAHLTLTSTLSNERVVAAAPNDDARQAENGLVEGQASQPRPPDPAENPLGTTLPASWVPDAFDIDFAKAVGMDDATLHDEVLMFHRLNAQNGTFSKNWKATWEIFCTRWKQRQPPKPRVDVDASATDGPSDRAAYVPKPIEYERALTCWATGDENAWPSRLLGPDPSQRGCRVPKEYLDKFNIDENGRVRPARKEAS